VGLQSLSQEQKKITIELLPKVTFDVTVEFEMKYVVTNNLKSPLHIHVNALSFLVIIIVVQFHRFLGALCAVE
jgi:hypothetical protein